MVIESLHCTGLCLLVFVVMPCLDNVIQMASVALGLSVLPACLQMAFKERQEEESKLKYFKLSLDVLTATVQVLFIVVWPLLMVVANKHGAVLAWSMPLSMVLVSTKWLENYIDHFHNKHPVRILLVNMNDSRSKLQLVASVWKVVLTLLLMPACAALLRDHNSHATSFTQHYASVFHIDLKLVFLFIFQ